MKTRFRGLKGFRCSMREKGSPWKFFEQCKWFNLICVFEESPLGSVRDWPFKDSMRHIRLSKSGWKNDLEILVKSYHNLDKSVVCLREKLTILNVVGKVASGEYFLSPCPPSRSSISEVG